ncbi:HNH endonuclease signature motif containing protein [Streptomyces sp. NPDC000609]|uniref:HNH endonuclease n=1 Tax=Streptomyces sp. NPDC000609 TaxID=3160957 RepID=UPI003392DC51
MVLFANNGLCVYCGAESRVMDHVIPFASGGADSPSNLVPACDSCNLSKGDTPLPQWIMRREFQKFTYWGDTNPLDEEGSLLDSYMIAHRECLRIFRRVESACLEIGDPQREIWFKGCCDGESAPRDRWQIDRARTLCAEHVESARCSGYRCFPPLGVLGELHFGAIEEDWDSIF